MTTPTEHSVRDLPAALDEQASLVETFKSRNALLQNSLHYFGYAIQQLDTGDFDEPAAIKGNVASEMLRFVGSPSQDNAASARHPSIAWQRLPRRRGSISRPSSRMGA